VTPNYSQWGSSNKSSLSIPPPHLAHNFSFIAIKKGNGKREDEKKGKKEEGGGR